MKDDIARVLVVFPEEWSRSKKQYVRLSSKGSKNPEWLGHKHHFSLNGNKAKVEYDEEDITKLENAPDFSILTVRNNTGSFRYEKKDGKWIQISE